VGGRGEPDLVAQAGRGEQVRERDVELQLAPQPGEELTGQQRVAAEGVEVVVIGWFGDAEQLSPDLAYLVGGGEARG
jgi:hypothetical protein